MNTSAAPRRRLLPTVVATAVVALFALVVPAAPAVAHDDLLSSDPAADAVLDSTPASITLTFSADVLDQAGATEVQVTDASGASVADGDPTVSGADVVQSLQTTASGTISVLWRVVSSDGHPIAGQFSFSVAGAPTPTSTPTPTATPSASASPTAAASPQSSPSAAETVSDASPLPWILLAVALLLVVGVLVWVAMSRGRRSPGDDGSAGTRGR